MNRIPGTELPRARPSFAGRVLLVALAFPTALGVASCRPRPPSDPQRPRVTVSRPVESEVVEWDEYTARLQATETVAVRARVSGYLESIHFREGAVVKKGDLLFTIDPRPYRAALRRAEAEHEVSQARLELARKKSERAALLVKREAISLEETDIREAEERQAEAAVAAAAAVTEAAQLDVEFTQIQAPIAGRVSRKLVTEGNLINGGIGAEGTLLTTIVSLDPIYAYIEGDERAYLKYIRLAKSGQRPSSREYQNPVRLALVDEEGFPHQGFMDFVDNQLDQGTGTILGRAVIANPDYLLTPGLFARLQLPGSGRFRALLLPDQAILFDQAERFVWVLDEKNQAQYRRVKVGRLHEGLRIVREGLEPADRVVVAGVQRLRPGLEVIAEEAPPPAAAGATQHGSEPAAAEPGRSEATR